MISFDQVLLLQKKVESAVQKIVELKTENDALRSKCSELTNALSEKTELLNSFTADEQKIESTIKDALNQLNTIEDTLVAQSGSTAPSQNTPVKKEAPAPQTQTSPAASKPASPAPAEPKPQEPSPQLSESQQTLDISTDDEKSEADDTVEEKFDIF